MLEWMEREREGRYLEKVGIKILPEVSALVQATNDIPLIDTCAVLVLQLLGLETHSIGHVIRPDQVLVIPVKTDESYFEEDYIAACGLETRLVPRPVYLGFDLQSLNRGRHSGKALDDDSSTRMPVPVLSINSNSVAANCDIFIGM